MKLAKTNNLPLDQFINFALYDKDKGFYMKKNPFGEDGDFITAPNVTRLFSEIIAIWTITFWKSIGSPKKFNLLELGAGNGEMMKVICETLKNFPEHFNSCNFINSELYGKVTEVPWAVTFIQVDNLSRHPSQLYEAIFEGIILFILLLYFRKKNFLAKPGLISGLFLIFYSVFRFCIEFFRVPDEQIGYLIFNLSMGQIISLVFIMIGTIIFYLKNENK